jgi:hypothetical protein
MNDNATMEQLNASLEIAVAAGAVHVCRKHRYPSYYTGSCSVEAAFDYYDENRTKYADMYRSDEQAKRFLGGAIDSVVGLRPEKDCFECNEGSHVFPVN